MPVTVGEFLEVARGMRKLGAAGFSFRGCEATFYDMPVEAFVDKEPEADDDDDAEAEDKAKRLARVRKAQLDADLYGSSG
jgi:hypothetical protein